MMLDSNFKAQRTLIVKFANSDDPDEVANQKQPKLDLHCLPSRLSILNMISLGRLFFEILQT